MALMTMEGLIHETYKRLSMATGIDTQTYAQDRIQSMLQKKFDMLYMHLWWPQFVFRGTYTLDGTTGMITGTLTDNIYSYLDIQHVWFGNEPAPLPEAPRSINPAVVKRRCITPSTTAGKFFKILPITTEGSVTILGQTRPYTDDAGFELDDEVNMDRELLVNGAALDFLTDDASNAVAENKFKQDFADRLKQFEARLQQRSRAIDGYTNGMYPTEWGA